MWILILILSLGFQSICWNGAWAQDAVPAPTSSLTTDLKRFMAGVRYDYTLHNDLRHSQLAPTSSPSFLSGSITGMRALAEFHYQPHPGTFLTAVLGSALLNSATFQAQTSAGNSQLVLPLENAVSFGAAARVDFFPQWRFHLVPSFRYLRTEYATVNGTLSNPDTGCSYSFSANTSSTCVTPGGHTGGGVLNGRISNNEFLFRLEMAVDIGGEINAPIVGIFVGAEEAWAIANATVVYSIPAAGQVFERYALTSARSEGIYAGLRSFIGPVRVQLEARGLTVTQFGGNLAVVF